MFNRIRFYNVYNGDNDYNRYNSYNAKITEIEEMLNDFNAYVKKLLDMNHKSICFLASALLDSTLLARIPASNSETGDGKMDLKLIQIMMGDWRAFIAFCKSRPPEDVTEAASINMHCIRNALIFALMRADALLSSAEDEYLANEEWKNL